MFFQPHVSPFRLAGHRSRTADAPSRRSLGEGGFTLIELLAVIAIVAILAGIVLGSGRRASAASKTARARAELAALSAALESYKLQHGDYPRTSDNATLVQSLIGKLGPTGAPLASAGRVHLETAKFNIALAATPDAPTDPFAESAAVLVDPWRQHYRYIYKSDSGSWTNPSFVLYSIGPDGADSLALLAGGYADTAAAANADNLYANRN